MFNVPEWNVPAKNCKTKLLNYKTMEKCWSSWLYLPVSSKTNTIIRRFVYNMANYASLHNSSHQIIGTHCNFVQKTCYSLCPEIKKWKLKCIIWAWLEVGLGLDKLRASEPASHASWASESCESSCEPFETDVSSQSIFLSLAFGGFWLFGTSFRYPRSPFNIVLLSAFIFFIFC